MLFFGKSAAQKRIDSDAVVIASQQQLIKELKAEIARTGVLLTKANEHMGWADNQTRAAIHERDTAQRERDGYREDALKYRKSIAPLAAANQRRRMEALNRAARVALEAATAKPNGTTEAAGLGAH